MKTKLLYSVFLTLSVCFAIQAQVMDYAFDGNLTGTHTLTAQGTFTAAYENDHNGTALSALTVPGASGDYLLSAYTGIAGTAARTLMAWVKTTAGGTTRNTIINYGVGNTLGTGMSLMIQQGRVRLEAGSSNIRTAANVLNDGNWHHVAVTFTDAATQLNEFLIYIDGANVSIDTQYTGTAIINTTASQVRIGAADYTASHYFRSGALDDVRIYNTALTPSEILTAAGLSAGTTPVADFSVSSQTPAQDQIITFTDLSTNTPTVWSWDFTGGVPATSSAQNPKVSYPTAGTYTVTLTASNTGGSSSPTTKTGYITVTAGSGTGNLQARYGFDGAITDASSYGRDLVTQGAFVPTYTADHLGAANSALTASGVYADHLVTGYPGIGGGNPRTVSAWFNTTGTSREPIVSWGVNSSGQMFNVMIENGVPRVEGGGSSLKSSDTGLNDATWHHIAVTFDPADNNGDGAGALSNCKIYIDGTLSGFGSSFAGTTVLNTDMTTNFLKIGSAVYSTFAFDGDLDDVRVYSKALTAAEVTAVMGGGVLAVKDVAFAPNEIKIFPNAVTDVLNIQTSDSQTLNISVYNVLGRLIKRVSSAKQVDMSNLATGLYIVKIRAGAKVASFKIIKK